ncbi:hypothetical protein [Porphyromonas levii]|uniref:hypothetical protein n=1 Tax=Porphyromonas levii TaxID=28114 RepID=UPI0003828B67|nr:hypothetical protein [Porphyromonas levii]
MRKYLTLLFTLLCFLLSESKSIAQTVIEGEVLEGNGAKVDGAMLFLIDPDTNRSISTAQSDEDGRFTFKSKRTIVEGKSLVVRGSLLGYKPLKVTIQYQSGTTLRLEMEATTFQLREVQIKAPAIREEGDTIVYRTSAFAQKQDLTLSQVIERMPGLEVVGGQIKYEGKGINKFYIEEMDLLGRRYAIASNSLRPDDVAAVEVYRNHEPIRMLETQSLSDRAALNIKLTEKAKGRWLAWVSAGVGASPLLYDLNARVMRFNSTSQGIYLIKANDTGKDMAAELRAHEQSTSRKMTFSLSDYTSPDFYSSMGESLQGSPIGNRQRFNHSYVFSGNQLLKLGNYQFLRINAIYSDERFSSSKQETIGYALPDGNRYTLESEQKYRLRERKMVLEGDYEYNGDASFFNNKTKVEHQSRHSQDIINQDNTPYQQDLSLPYTKVENSTEYLFRAGETLVKLSNIAKYLSRNQSITITLPRSQSIKSKLLDNSLTIGANWRWGEHQLDNTLQWDIQYHNIEVESSWLDDNSATPSKYLSNSIGWRPQYNWKSNNWHITAELPITYYLYRYPQAHESFAKSDFYLRGSRYWDNNLKVNASYSFYHNLLGAASQFPGLKVMDSRRLTEKLPRPYQGNTHVATVNLSYSVPISGTAITAGSNFSKNKRLYTSSSSLQDGFIIFRSIERPSLSTNWGANLRVAQTFWQGKIDAAIRGSYSRNWSDMLVQEQITSLISDSYTSGLDLSFRFTPDINLDYSGSIVGSNTNSQGGRVETHARLLSQIHKGRLLVWLSDNWSATAAAEYHNTLQGNTKANAEATFLDLGVKYQSKKIKIDLLLSNITNQKNYEVITISEPHTYRTITPLRPLEILLTFTLLR